MRNKYLKIIWKYFNEPITWWDRVMFTPKMQIYSGYSGSMHLLTQVIQKHNLKLRISSYNVELSNLEGSHSVALASYTISEALFLVLGMFCEQKLKNNSYHA